MARSRNIKPGFFRNEDLAQVEFAARLLFAGLWCLADREGRLEDRPLRIKGELFPYDNVDTDNLLQQLASRGLVVRYTVDGNAYIWIPKFTVHQNPHHAEKPSIIPPATSEIQKLRDKPETSPRQDEFRSVPNVLIPDSLLLIPDSLNLIPDSKEKASSLDSTSLVSSSGFTDEIQQTPCPGCLKHPETKKKYLAQCDRLNFALVNSTSMSNPNAIACRDAVDKFCNAVQARDVEWCAPSQGMCYPLLIEPRLQREINGAKGGTSSIGNRRQWAQTWLPATLTGMVREDGEFYSTVGYRAKGRARP